MKITTQLLRTRAHRPLHGCEILDLSNLEIECIDKLQTCPKLRSLTLRKNCIDYVSGLETCPQLWKLDLSSNKIQNLDGLRRFVAMGTLVLSNNCLTWAELAKIRHLHILDISLHGNPYLEKDPYYRIHVIDVLPNIWMLDGRIVTSAERIQVQQFFADSALTERPVRHKLSKDTFTPTTMKQIEVTGIFGERTDHLMRRFPVNGAMNIETDRRRLKYLAYNIQEDIKFEGKYNKELMNVLPLNNDFLEDLLDDRTANRVRCNMMLLILVASLEFAMPIQLMNAALQCTKLDRVGSTDIMSLFMLPREIRSLIISLLLSAVKVDKDVGEDGGLYDKLYLSLYYSVSELTRLSQGVSQLDQNSSQLYTTFRGSKSLIASEVVQLFCVVPLFFECLCRDAGVMNMVAIATGDPIIIEKIQKIMKKLEKDGCDEAIILESISRLILATLNQNNEKHLHKAKAQTDDAKYILNTKMAIPIRHQPSIISSEYHAAGRPTPERKTPRLKSGRHDRRPFMPIAKLGEEVLLGPQNVGRIISIPEPDLVLIQMNVIPSATGAMIMNTKNPDEHFTYVDINQLFWDSTSGFWRPKGTTGDRITVTSGSSNSGYPTMTSARKSHMESSSRNNVMNVQSQLVDLLFKGESERDGAALPEPVSARYKKQCNLKLSWKQDLVTTDYISPAESEEQCEDFENEYQNQDLDKNDNFAAPDAMEGVVSMETAEDADMSHPVSRPSTSRRSSLESDFEPELNQFEGVECSQSGSSLSKRQESGSASAPPIHIPQVNEDLESQKRKLTSSSIKHHHLESSDIINKKERLKPFQPSSGAGVFRNDSLSSGRGLRAPNFITWPRPISAFDTYHLFLSPENKYYSRYQKQCTNAWKFDDKNVLVLNPPPQPPCSPIVKDLDPADKHNIVKVQRGEAWLGAGRDLHWERQNSLPRTAHIPGWMEGLPQRPHSEAAVRALRRSKTPTIATPSSIAYESLFRPQGLKTLLNMPAPTILNDTQLSRPRSSFPIRKLGAVPACKFPICFSSKYQDFPSSLYNFWMSVDAQ